MCLGCGKLFPSRTGVLAHAARAHGHRKEESRTVAFSTRQRFRDRLSQPGPNSTATHSNHELSTEREGSTDAPAEEQDFAHESTGR